MVNPLTILSMGWGVQTWTLAAMVALEEHPRPDYIIHADTGHERAATYDFARQWTPWLGEHGLDVFTVRGGENEVVVEKRAKSVMIPAFTTDEQTGEHGQVRRQCTGAWKIAPIRRFIRAAMEERGLKQTPRSVESWLGISRDEFARMRDSDVKYITNVYPLVDLRMSRADCHAWLDQHQLPAPPKSACTFCPYHSLASWKLLKQQGGPDWQEAVAVDAAIREKRPPHALYVHPGRRPLAEAVSIPEDFGAEQLGFDDLCDGGVCGV
jgi:hypothetical protein